MTSIARDTIMHTRKRPVSQRSKRTNLNNIKQFSIKLINIKTDLNNLMPILHQPICCLSLGNANMRITQLILCLRLSSSQTSVSTGFTGFGFVQINNRLVD